MNFDAFENDEIEDGITTVCFTGHRSIPENVRPAVSELLSEVIWGLYLRGARIFKAGGAIGFDTMAAQAVIDLRSKTGDRSVKLNLCLPAPDQTKKFSRFDKIIYDLVRENSDCVTYVSKYSTTESYYERNRRLVQNSDVCVAYCTKQRGGTYYTCKQALLGGVEFINLADFIVFE
ncbi:MAG: DUF1273 family protein [Clostridia bacterium]|nr:DUF1273 family protein [Clostridia bacterium]